MNQSLEKSFQLDQALGLFHDCRYQEAEHCFIGLLQQSPRDPDIQYHYAQLLLEARQYRDAKKILNTLVILDQRNIAYLSSLALAHQRLGEYGQARRRIDEALMLDSRHPLIAKNYGMMVIDTQPRIALESLQKSVEANPDDAMAQHSLAAVAFRCHEFSLAEKAARRAVELRPGFEAAHTNLLVALEEQGKLAEAVECLEKISALFPDGSSRTLISAKILRKTGRTKEAIALLEAENYPDDPLTVLSANNELGHLYDAAANTEDAIEEAFDQFMYFNKIAAEHWQITEENKKIHLDEIESCKKTFTLEWVKSWAPYTPAEGAKTPAFIFSFARTGSTLLQYILQGHPGIYASDEIPALAKVVENLTRPDAPYPSGLARLSDGDIRKQHEIYFAEHEKIKRYRENLFLIDKNPMATAHIGTVHRIFPDAKLLFVSRHPCDSVLSCYTRFFHPSTVMIHMFNMKDIVNLYCRTMDLWQQYAEALPLDVHYVRYEDMVEDYEGEARKAIEFLGLPWDDSVLEYQKSAREKADLRTPNREQIRQKIYDRSRYRWQRYRTHLEPHLAQLEPYIKRFGYEL